MGVSFIYRHLPFANGPAIWNLHGGHRYAEKQQCVDKRGRTQLEPKWIQYDGDCIAINSLYGNGHNDTIAERVSMAIATAFEKSVYSD